MLDLSGDWGELPSRLELHQARGVREMDAPPAPGVQPRWDIPELVVVTAAVSGRTVREADEGAPTYTADHDGFADAAVASIDAGACGIHVDFGGIDSIEGSGLSVPDNYSKLISAIDTRTRHDWVCDANILRGRNFAENLFPISSGLAETAPMAPSHPEEWTEAVSHVVTERGGRVFFSIHSAAEVDLANRLVLAKGILPQPTCWIILIGYPYTAASHRLATYLAHPRAMVSELVQIVDRIHEIDRDAFIQVCAAGRAGHYLATTAMLLGLHVRVGTEDTVYRYPHRDELLDGSAEMVERVKATAQALGRRLATAAEFRELIGMAPRSAAPAHATAPAGRGPR
ncbi:3-keto-5-aminohexanoate cleavage protein [Streptomyces albipurpureus]|uniref:3-keto-5-aminohexanoate cleavage protein n=1 Tax=Streptomyces albipurpureus TaxID=2897419 RepID=A0ABT0UYT1_9ACTN|nr:3-keto-5-aminohexanoate cleavage protein [Streptomyces sp. CWNU-1]MCM2393733.1 3-keto-5-aminohexanoate cleavage protein [Streptomyces sp. CWNU-1]